MLKGFVILLLIGISFAYFVFNFVGDVEESDPNSYVSKNQKKAKEWAKYYTKDVLGQPVLNLKGASLKTAKEVWKDSQLRLEMLEVFPNFEGMREFVEERLKDSPFREYLLQKIDKIESAFQEGSIDSARAKKMLTDL